MPPRIGCKFCNYKGYTKHSFYAGSDDASNITVSICSHCKDARGYYAYVKNKYGNTKETSEENKESIAKVLDFNSYIKNKEK